MPNVKKFRYCCIKIEIEEKLDLIFDGVVATGVHSWMSNQEVNDNVHEQNNSERWSNSNDSIDELLRAIDSHIESIHARRPPSLGPRS